MENFAIIIPLFALALLICMPHADITPIFNHSLSFDIVNIDEYDGYYLLGISDIHAKTNWGDDDDFNGLRNVYQSSVAFETYPGMRFYLINKSYAENSKVKMFRELNLSDSHLMPVINDLPKNLQDNGADIKTEYGRHGNTGTIVKVKIVKADDGYRLTLSSDAANGKKQGIEGFFNGIICFIRQLFGQAC